MFERLEGRIVLDANLAIGLNFTGSNISQSGFIPPDTDGAVGPDHFVELINGRYVSYDKTNGSVVESSSLNQFWIDAGASATGNAFDPRIIYDHASQRWIACAVDNARSANSFLLAISANTDPTGTWSGFKMDSDSNDTHWADYPTLGVDADGVYLAANMFPISTGNVFATIVSIPKADLLSATPTVANRTVFEEESISTRGFAIQPAVDYEASDGRAALLADDADVFGVLNRTNILNAGTNAASLSSTTNITVNNFANPPDADQPGTKQNLETNDTRISATVMEVGNSLWAVQCIDDSGRAAVRWYEIDEPTSAVLQQGTITDPDLSFYFPAISANSFGDVVISFTGSSENQFASTYAVLGTTSAGVTTFQTPILLKAGVDDYQRLDGAGRNRWGDYSAISRDPDDPRKFWTIQEWCSADNTWATQITELTVIPDSDIVLNSVTSDGASTLTVQYQIIGSDSAAFDVGFYASSDSLFGGDSLLDFVTIDQPGDLSVGIHTKDYTIGSGAGQVALPGAGLADTFGDVQLLVVADHNNVVPELDADPFNEDNTKSFVGAYHLSNAEVMAFGSSVADTLTFAVSGANTTLNFNGTIYTYASSGVTALRARGAGGGDTISSSTAAKPSFFWGSSGTDTLTGGSQGDQLIGGADNDTLSGNAGNDAYLFDTDSPLGSDTLNESAGLDVISFAGSSTLGHVLNLGLTTAQTVNANLVLTLTSATMFDNVIGGDQGDTLTGNTAANQITGGLGNDSLNGNSGNDTYFFDADLALGTDTLSDASGTDTLDFSATSIGVTVDLNITSAQIVNANLTLNLGSVVFENATGGSGGDSLFGNSLVNRLEGNAGNDTLEGRLGSDTYAFDADTALGTDNVTEVASGGTDTLDFSATTGQAVSLNLGTVGNQVVNANLTINLSANNLFENVVGGSQNDTLTGNSLSNSLTGGPGSDTLTGGTMNDTYVFAAAVGSETDSVVEIAGEGIDTLSFAALSSSVPVTVDLSTAGTTLATHAGRTVVVPSPGDAGQWENVTGGAGNDTITGNGLANRIEGRAGNDTLNGNSGDDTYVFDADTALGSDTIDESAGGADTLDFSLTTNFSITIDLANPAAQAINANLTLNLSSATTMENVIGGGLADNITGNTLANRLEGRSGNDTLTGGGNNDTYAFDADATLGTDTLNESGGGIDTLDFAATTTVAVTVDLGISSSQTVNAFLTLVLGTASNFENVTGGSKNDLIRGNANGNLLNGGPGNDILVGKDGADTLIGGQGRDLLFAGLGGDTLNGDADDDLLIAGTTSYDDTNSSLNTILTEWGGANTYTTRIANLHAGISGINLNAGSTVLDDGVVDTLTGGSAMDWFFAALGDTVTDKIASEILDLL